MPLRVAPCPLPAHRFPLSQKQFPKPQTYPTVLSTTFSRLKCLPKSSIPACYLFLLRFNLPWLVCADLSTPPAPLRAPTEGAFCFEYPAGAFEAELKAAINPKVFTPERPAWSHLMR